MTCELDIVDERNGYALMRSSDGRGTVIGLDRSRGQVWSAMPGDMPKGSGIWVARLSSSGINYVSNLYSWSYARRMFRQFAAEAALAETEA